ncbi:phage virion morphogenesis protein [Microvirgula sp. AG722]|uniref:phage virion morphogenesis protein n=1 Tax=Microvirgula sp. AG722 TaxID=2183901 RepID=UPI000DC3AB8D|nr:phage virion morphogenesis protein [Microvirgula sp. AG722]RAS18929.1 phage virion morphogenesis protein [Microvirgula sp. AG722]
MSDFVSITVDDSQLQAALQRLESSVLDMTPAMRKIAGTLAHAVEENLEAEGRPRWAPSQRASSEGGVTLQQSGRLASSVVTDYDAASVVIGSNTEYARIHQLGGKAGRGHSVELPARPYLPITADGDLQPESSEAVLGTVLRHLKTAAGV